MKSYSHYSKEKSLVYTAFPSLSKNLTPVAAAYGLAPLELPGNVAVRILESHALVEGVLSSVIMASLDLDKNLHLCVSLDAEWNVSHCIGISILQLLLHSDPHVVYLILVCQNLNYAQYYPFISIYRFINSQSSLLPSSASSSVIEYSKLDLLSKQI